MDIENYQSGKIDKTKLLTLITKRIKVIENASTQLRFLSRE
jgi:hypothetical protein